MRRFIVTLIVLVAAVLLGSTFLVGRIARAVVADAGPKVVGVPIHLTDASFNPLTGTITIKGFTLGNPTGFKSEQSVGVGRAEVVVKPAALFKDPLVIERIRVSHPRLTYEIGLGSSNFGRIQENVESRAPAGRTDGRALKQKKVIIRDLLIEDGEIGVALAAAGGKGVTVPLPTIHLTDVGNETGGAEVRTIVGQVLGQVVAAAGEAAGSLINVAGDAAGAAGNAAGEGAGAVGDAAGKAAKKVGGLFGGGKK